jgi:hypothetical protein
MHQLAYKKWVPVLPNTIGPCDFPRANIKVGENDVQLVIWDTVLLSQHLTL